MAAYFKVCNHRPPPPHTHKHLHCEEWVRAEASADHFAMATEQPHLVQMVLGFFSLGSSGPQNYLASTVQHRSPAEYHCPSRAYPRSWSLAPPVGL